MSEIYIAHHGIKGMKWGVRRYQNKDGSLTPAGKKRQARQDYRDAKDLAFKKYEKSIGSIEKGYKRGQTLSDKDLTREQEAEVRYRKTVSKAKQDYKNAKANIEREKQESILRGEELHKQLIDPNNLRWNEDRNMRLINKMSKKDWADIEAYQRDSSIRDLVSTATLAMAGLGVVLLMDSRYMRNG